MEGGKGGREVEDGSRAGGRRGGGLLPLASQATAAVTSRPGNSSAGTC
jgi:hypothetical protein